MSLWGETEALNCLSEQRNTDFDLKIAEYRTQSATSSEDYRMPPTL